MYQLFDNGGCCWLGACMGVGSAGAVPLALCALCGSAPEGKVATEEPLGRTHEAECVEL